MFLFYVMQRFVRSFWLSNVYAQFYCSLYFPAFFLIMKNKHIQERVNIQGTKDSLEMTFAVLNDSTQFETFFVIVVPL